MTAATEALFSELNHYPQRIPGDVLRRWLNETPLEIGDFERFMKFHSDRYLRNLVEHGPAYHALLLCWKNGQRSPIHDHTGSNCAVKVMRGVATETIFERAPNGMVFATRSQMLEAGHTAYSEDSDIHQISNLQAGNAELVTLHIYSPPLIEMHMYSLLDDSISRYIDPINDEFVSGAGI